MINIDCFDEFPDENEFSFALLPGLIIGWFSLVSDILTVIGCIVSIVLLSIYSCEDIKKVIESSGETAVDSQSFDEVCSVGKGSKNSLHGIRSSGVAKRFFFQSWWLYWWSWL